MEFLSNELDSFMNHTNFPSFTKLIPELIPLYLELGEGFFTTSNFSFLGVLLGSVPQLEEKYECIPSHKALFFPLLRHLENIAVTTHSANRWSARNHSSALVG